MTDHFSGLRVAITGGTSGLGLALVRELVNRGARVAFVARTRERVEQVARENPGAHGIVGDVSVKEDIYPIAIRIYESKLRAGPPASDSLSFVNSSVEARASLFSHVRVKELNKSRGRIRARTASSATSP